MGEEWERKERGKYWNMGHPKSVWTGWNRSSIAILDDLTSSQLNFLLYMMELEDNAYLVGFTKRTSGMSIHLGQWWYPSTLCFGLCLPGLASNFIYSTVICIFIVYSLEIKSTISVLMCACTSSKGKLPRGCEGKAGKGVYKSASIFLLFLSLWHHFHTES